MSTTKYAVLTAASVALAGVSVAVGVAQDGSIAPYVFAFGFAFGAVGFGNKLREALGYAPSTYEGGPSFQADNVHRINPSTGLPMTYGGRVDIQGNAFGAGKRH